MIDVPKLLDPISTDAPCGENLEYDAAFGALEQAARGTPEQQIGSVVTAAEEPSWRDVQKEAVVLLARSKDLRVAVYLTQALIFTEGPRGLREGLALVRGLLERYWGPLHPQLDPDDDHDPTQRINVLMALCDPSTVLKGVRQAHLATSRALGRYSLRDIHLATGRLAAPAGADQTTPKIETIHAAFADSDLENLQATADAVLGSLDEVNAIETYVTGVVGAGHAPNFGALAELLKETRQVLGEQLAQRGARDVVVAVGAPDAPTNRALPASPPPRVSEINSREEVARRLDETCAYFDRHEPSSPVPLLLRRAKRLVARNFMDIIRDLTPDAVSPAELIGGAQTRESPPDESTLDLTATLKEIDQLVSSHRRSERAPKENAAVAPASLPGADTKVGGGENTGVTALLTHIHELVREKLAQCGAGDASGTEANQPLAEVVPIRANPIPRVEITTREQVVEILEKICDYFGRSEPSSPVSVLVRRAQRLVSKDFFEIIRDLAPGAVKQAELIGGDAKQT